MQSPALQHLKDPGRWDGESHPRQSLSSERGARLVSAAEPDVQEANSSVVRVPRGCAARVLPYKSILPILIEKSGSSNQPHCSSEDLCLAPIQNICWVKSSSKCIAQMQPLWAAQTWCCWVTWCRQLPQGIPAHSCFFQGRPYKSWSPCLQLTWRHMSRCSW